MIQSITTVLNAALSGLDVHERHGLAQIVSGSPHTYSGAGEWKPVTADGNGTWSYMRINGQIRAEVADIGQPCMGKTVSVPMRLVAYLDRSQCLGDSDTLWSAAASMQGARKQLIAATSAMDVRVVGMSWGVDIVTRSEYAGEVNIPTGKALSHIDFTVQIEGSDACFAPCDPVDVTCAIISAATNAKVVQCLGDRINDICGGSLEIGDLHDNGNPYWNTFSDTGADGPYTYTDDGN